MNKEIWKIVYGHDDYKVSNYGRIKSLRRYINRKVNPYWKDETILTGTLNWSGYIMVYLDGKQQRLHRLVAKAFIPNTKDKKCINHKNGIKTDNHVENLEWCTRKENNIHAWENGLINNRGEKQTNSKLTDLNVWEIKFLVSIGEEQKSVSNLFDVSPQTINGIIKNRTWKHINISQIPQ
jgi:hypothetical protein